MSKISVNVKAPISFKNGGEFFYGANTHDGFREYYSDFININECDRIFNIIGGPGTGKSTLMKKIAEECLNVGCECEKYFCSSDTASLDAIRIYSPESEKVIAICDATAPHERAFDTPGAVTSIIDLSRFWDITDLESNKNAILDLQDKKKESYLKAYTYIKLLATANRAIEKEISSYICRDKLIALCEELTHSLKGENSNRNIFLRPTTALSMKGEHTLTDEYWKAERSTVIQDVLGTSTVLIKALFKRLETQNVTVFASPSCEVCGGYTQLYIPESKLLISTVPSEKKEIVSTKEIISKCIPKSSRVLIESLQKTAKKAKTAALHELSLARDHHFALEKIYGRCMDFDSKDKFDTEIVNNISHYIK